VLKELCTSVLLPVLLLHQNYRSLTSDLHPSTSDTEAPAIQEDWQNMSVLYPFLQQPLAYWEKSVHAQVYVGQGL
jgi:hypothetical protein